MNCLLVVFQFVCDFIGSLLETQSSLCWSFLPDDWK